MITSKNSSKGLTLIDFNIRLVLVFITLLALKFFTIIFFTRQALALIDLVGAILVVVTVLLYQVFSFQKIQTIPMTFNKWIVMILFSILGSMVMANTFHSQSFGITLFAQKFTYYFLFYYVLHYLKVDIKFIENLIIVYGITWCLIYLIQYKIYPNLIISSRVDMDRGTVRIFFPGNVYALVTFFYFLHKSLTEKFKLGYGLYILVFIVIVGVLQGTRSNLGAIIMLVGMFVFFYKKVKNRIGIMLLVGLMGFGMFLMFSDVFTEMLDVSEKQMNDLEEQEPIRKRSLRFFMGEFQQSPLTYILGNGYSHGSSPYGSEIIYYKKEYGYYQSDIGFAGEYSSFGIFFALAEIIIVFGGIFRRLPHNVSYFKYVFAFLVISGTLGAGPFNNGDKILSIMIVLYMIDVAKYNEKKTKVHEQTKIGARFINFK